MLFALEFLILIIICIPSFLYESVYKLFFSSSAKMDNIDEDPILTLRHMLISDLKQARRMLEAGADVDAVFQGKTLLHEFVEHDYLPGIQLLLDYGADMSIRCEDSQFTALHIAAASRAPCLRDSSNYHVCKLLLESGADCDSQAGAWTSVGITPILCALACRNMKVVRLLLDYGADIDTWPRLHFAACNRNNVDSLQFVLDQKCDLDRGDEHDLTALHYATWNRNLEGCKILLKRGSMVNRKSIKIGHTPLSLIIEGPRDYVENSPPEFVTSWAQTVQLLLDNGADMSEKVQSESILEIAAKANGQQRLREVLMRHMAKMEYLHLKISDYDRRTIQSRECYNKYYEMCLQEIENMKKPKFYSELSVSFLFKSKKLISGYARNEELIEAFSEALTKNDYGKEFPIYFVSLQKSFDAIVKLQKLRDHAAKILKNIFNFVDPFHLVNRKIIFFLNDEDFSILLTEVHA